MQPTIPTFDIARFSVDPTAFAKALGLAYEDWGFVGLINHGIDSALIDQSLDCAARLFALPDSVKRRYDLTPGGVRGYTPFARETAKGASNYDLKEFWHVGREIDPEQARYAQLKPNIWPAEIDDFRSVTLALYQALEELGGRVLSALAIHLGLPPDWFEPQIDQGNSILRLLHYPPIPTDEPGGHVRAAAHEDINLITLLVGSREAGLEILTRRNEWVPVSMMPGTVIVNIGDMLQRLTNGLLPSTTHRVVNPTGEARLHSRYSLPFFLHPNPDMRLDVLPQCVAPGDTPRYAPISADEFLQERLREIGLLD